MNLQKVKLGKYRESDALYQFQWYPGNMSKVQPSSQQKPHFNYFTALSSSNYLALWWLPSPSNWNYLLFLSIFSHLRSLLDNLLLNLRSTLSYSHSQNSSNYYWLIYKPRIQVPMYFLNCSGSTSKNKRGTISLFYKYFWLISYFQF